MASNMATNKTLSALLQGKLVKGVLVKGAKHAMGAGAGLAAGALSGLPVTTFEPYTVAYNLTRGYRVEGECRVLSHCVTSTSTHLEWSKRLGVVHICACCR